MYSFAAYIILLFYKDIFFAKGAWLVADHAEQHFPWANYLSQSLKQGVLPFWTDLIQSGFPISAEGQIGSFYLPNLLFYSILPIRQGYAWNIVFHILLSAFFMMRYLDTLKIAKVGVLFGTLVYLFGSTLGGAYYNITSLKVLTWFPLGLILIDRLLLSKKFPWVLTCMLGVVFSLQILVGYLQFAAYSMLFTGLYFIGRWFELEKRTFKKFMFGALGLAIATAVAIMICYPQLFLTFKLAVISNRANPSEGFAYVGSYSPLAIICMIYPSL